MRSFCKSAVWSLKHWSSTKLALHSAKFPFRDGEPGMAFSKHGYALVIQDSSYTKLVTNCSFWVYNSKGISELKVLKGQGSKAAHATDSKRNFWHSFLRPSHSSPDFLGGKKCLRYRIFWQLLAHRLTRLSMGYKYLTRRSRLMLELWTPYELRWTEMERGIWGYMFQWLVQVVTCRWGSSTWFLSRSSRTSLAACLSQAILKANELRTRPKWLFPDVETQHLDLQPEHRWWSSAHVSSCSPQHFRNHIQ